jgi:hypothetical protein
MYGAETQTVKQKDKSKIQTVCVKCLRSEIIKEELGVYGCLKERNEILQ